MLSISNYNEPLYKSSYEITPDRGFMSNSEAVIIILALEQSINKESHAFDIVADYIVNNSNNIPPTRLSQIYSILHKYLNDNQLVNEDSTCMSDIDVHYGLRQDLYNEIGIILNLGNDEDDDG